MNDSHGTMRNVKIEELSAPVSLISNNSKSLGMMEGISADFDAVFFIGYHAMEGQPGILAHTGSGGKIADISVNGRSMSEGGMNARVAGSYGVPVVLATGDDAFANEIRTARHWEHRDRCRETTYSATNRAAAPSRRGATPHPRRRESRRRTARDL